MKDISASSDVVFTPDLNAKHLNVNIVMGFQESIQSVKGSVKEFTDGYDLQNRASSILEKSAQVVFDPSVLTDILAQIETSSTIKLSEDSEETKDKAESLRSSLDAQAKEFCLGMGFALVADSYLDDIRQSLSQDSAQATRNFAGFEIRSEALCAIERLCVLLELIIYVVGEGSMPSAKSSFFQILQTVTETLLPISSEVTEVFWHFMESHIDVISEKVFDANVTQDRIALLKICNGLTDKYYERNNAGKYDSYKKDSFNDKFHARVRAFVASVFNFDDATGLNKLLQLASRTNKEPHLGASKSSDGHLLREILSFQRLLRDPYTFLKNPRLLSSQLDTMSRLSSYFLDEEAKYAKIHPMRDMFAVSSNQTTPAVAETPVFSPEQYWLSAFVETQSGEEFEKLRAQDEKISSKKFDLSKFRNLLLVQIFMVSCFFSELLASRKQAMLKTADNESAAKHIIDETTPEHIASRCQKLKKDILRLVRTWNSSLSYLLQHLSHSEEYWWSWLIDGRQKGGSVLIKEGHFGEDNISATQEKFNNVAPYKTKRYFNTHATPQLSRRFKVKTGLDLLEETRDTEMILSDDLEKINEQLAAESTEEGRESLLEQKNILIWKKIKSLRGSSWLSLDQHLSCDELTDPQAEERKRAQKQKEKEKREKQENKKENETDPKANDGDKNDDAEEKAPATINDNELEPVEIDPESVMEVDAKVGNVVATEVPIAATGDTQTLEDADLLDYSATPAAEEPVHAEPEVDLPHNGANLDNAASESSIDTTANGLEEDAENKSQPKEDIVAANDASHLQGPETEGESTNEKRSADYNQESEATKKPKIDSL